MGEVNVRDTINYNWTCPDCLYNYTEPMPKPKCFCSRENDPKLSPHYLPHSCGKVCKKKRNEDCTHLTCNYECHPGPCPPC